MTSPRTSTIPPSGWQVEVCRRSTHHLHLEMLRHPEINLAQAIGLSAHLLSQLVALQLRIVARALHKHMQAPHLGRQAHQETEEGLLRLLRLQIFSMPAGLSRPGTLVPPRPFSHQGRVDRKIPCKRASRLTPIPCGPQATPVTAQTTRRGQPLQAPRRELPVAATPPARTTCLVAAILPGLEHLFTRQRTSEPLGGTRVRAVVYASRLL